MKTKITDRIGLAFIGMLLGGAVFFTLWGIAATTYMLCKIIGPGGALLVVFLVVGAVVGLCCSKPDEKEARQ